MAAFRRRLSGESRPTAVVARRGVGSGPGFRSYLTWIRHLSSTHLTSRTTTAGPRTTATRGSGSRRFGVRATHWWPMASRSTLASTHSKAIRLQPTPGKQSQAMPATLGCGSCRTIRATLPAQPRRIHISPSSSRSRPEQCITTHAQGSHQSPTARVIQCSSVSALGD